MKIIPLKLEPACGHDGSTQGHEGIVSRSATTSLASIIPLFAQPRILRPELDPRERLEREQCEAAIARRWDTFLEVGKALGTIRNKRLYRDRYRTFEEYCRQKWEFSRSDMKRLVEASVVASLLIPIGVRPTSESQLRPLVGLPLTKIPQAWKKAEQLAGGRRVTARMVRLAVEGLSVESARPVSQRKKSANCRQEVANRLGAMAESAAKTNDTAKLLKILSRLRRLISGFRPALDDFANRA